MSRLLVFAWGADAKRYVGRSMTLYRDPSVKWGGMEVGGIRISHMSDIDKTFVLSLTATKGQRKPYTVRPLQIERQPAVAEQGSSTDAVDTVQQLIDDAKIAAMDGTAAYQTFFGALSREDKTLLIDRGEHVKNKTAAEQTDRPADYGDAPTQAEVA